MTASLDPIRLPITGARVALEQADRPGSLDIRRLADDTVVGHVTLELDEGVLHVAELIIEPEYRGYGAGTEAARLLIAAAESASLERITAWAPPDLGLAAYFWYRMGLRALHGPGPDGGISYERKLH